MKTIMSKLAIILAVIILLAAAIPVKSVNAASVTLSVDAPSEVTKGTSFTVNMVVDSVAKLKSWQFQVAYEDNIIRIQGKEGVTGVYGGKFGNTSLPTPIWSYSPAGEPGNMAIKGQSSSLLSGEGSLVRISFIAMGDPGSKSEIKLSNMLLTDESGQSIDVSGTNATVTVVSPAESTTPPSPTRSTTTPPAGTTTTAKSPDASQPPKTETASTPVAGSTPKATGTASPSATSASPSATSASPTATSTSREKSPARITIEAPHMVQPLYEFAMRIDIIKVAELDSFHLILEYDPEVLVVNDVSSGMIGSDEIEITEWSLTPPETQGKVEMMGIIKGGKGANGAGYLAKIHCQMIGEMGQKSELTLSEIELTDIDGEFMVIEPVPGASVEVEATKVSTVMPKEVPQDGQFEATVDITQVTGLASYSLVIEYNPSVIEIIEVNPGMIASTEVPVDDWDFIPPGEQGEVYIKGAFDEDLGGIKGSGCLARIQCLAVGRLTQRGSLAIKKVELFDEEGEPVLQSPPEDGSILIANPSFLSSTLGLVVVIVAGLVVIGLAIFFILRRLRRGGVQKATRPSPSQGKKGKQPKVEEPEDLIEVMRSRISQLPSRRGGRKPGSGEDKPE